MNTDFARMTPPMVEQYFQTALFYSIYPSFFSADAATRTYWSDPALYERDRPLFRRYIPWIRALARAGWEPITGARVAEGRVLVERYGSGDGVTFAVRNQGAERVEFRLEIDAFSAGLAGQGLFRAIEWIGGVEKKVESDGQKLYLAATIDPGQTQCWQLRPR